jgi:LysM repeat protein
MALIRLSVLAAAGWWFCGCGPIAEDGTDETKNPHYQVGKSRLISRDYAGAAEAFKKALEANPQSAAAHYELGLLYYQNLSDYAAAIYHFREYLKLRPEASQRENLNQFIVVCKQELARDVSLALVNQQVQRQLDVLARENLQLQQQVATLKQQLLLSTNRPLETSMVASSLSPGRVTTNTTSPRQPAPAPVPAPSSKVRAHTIKAGDTPASLARQYGVKLSALLAANRGLDPKKLKVGQVVNIPAP